MARLLLIDDSELVLDMLGMALSSHELTRAADASEAAAAVSRETFDAIVTDLNFPGLEGKDAVTLLRECGAEETPIYIMSGKPVAELDEIASEVGAQASLSKDLGLPAMAARIEVLLSEL